MTVTRVTYSLLGWGCPSRPQGRTAGLGPPKGKDLPEQPELMQRSSLLLRGLRAQTSQVGPSWGPLGQHQLSWQLTPEPVPGKAWDSCTGLRKI